MMSDKEIIFIVGSHEQGKKIEYSWGHCVNWYEFCPAEGDGWNFQKYTYRIAHEPRKPREWWLTQWKYGLCHISETKIDDAHFHVREVIE